jgi:hypothetical protein
MKKTKLTLILLKLLKLLLFIFIVYLLYLYLFNSLYVIKDNFSDTDPNPAANPKYNQYLGSRGLAASEANYKAYLLTLPPPTTTYNIKKGEDTKLQQQKDAENAMDSASDIPEDSGKCGYNVDVIDYCINYKSCCSKMSDSSKCLCDLPFIKNCRDSFNACLNNNPSELKKNELMAKCVAKNKSCCQGYANVSVDSSNFNKPIKNAPVITPICNLTDIKNLPQKCMELCQNHPNCQAYSITVGKIAQDIGTCNIYDKVNIVAPDIDPGTGKAKQNVSTDYYTKLGAVKSNKAKDNHYYN